MTYAEITNKKTGVKLTGEHHVGYLPNEFSFTMDGNSLTHALLLSEWDVAEIPEPIELPTKLNAIVQVEDFWDDDHKTPERFILVNGGPSQYWVSLGSYNPVYLCEFQESTQFLKESIQNQRLKAVIIFEGVDA